MVLAPCYGELEIIIIFCTLGSIDYYYYYYYYYFTPGGKDPIPRG